MIIKHGHNLYDPEEVVKKGNGGKAITTLMSWKKVKLGREPEPWERDSDGLCSFRIGGSESSRRPS